MLFVQPGHRGSNELRVGRKMATFQLFFQSGRAKDLSAPPVFSLFLNLNKMILKVYWSPLAKYLYIQMSTTDIILFISHIVLFSSSVLLARYFYCSYNHLSLQSHCLSMSSTILTFWRRNYFF